MTTRAPDAARRGDCKIEVHLLALTPGYAELRFAAPFKIGSGLIQTATCLTVTARVRTRDGREGMGQGAVLLSHVWAWPGPEAPARKESAMRRAAEERIRSLLAAGEWRTPLDWYSDFLTTPPDGVPALAAAVAFSPIDAAIHDALGRAVGASSYDLLPESIRRHLLPEPRPSVPIMHTVGLADSMQSLDTALGSEGVRGLKIKLGGDPAADAARTGLIYEYASRVCTGLYLSVDGNESYAGAEAVMAYLERLPGPVLAALSFMEQPVPRSNLDDMSGPAAITPILADEGWVRPADLAPLLGRGWSGAVLKTCKGHSAVLLALTLLAREGRPYAMGDLTNPGIALLHSLGLAARCSPLAGMEANARQYLPAYHPSGFPVRTGELAAAALSPLGLGY